MAATIPHHCRPLRDELRGIGLQIRAGPHTGEVELRDGDLDGIVVDAAARVMASPDRVRSSRPGPSVTWLLDPMSW
jgi:class 3 adenylate cyclase